MIYSCARFSTSKIFQYKVMIMIAASKISIKYFHLEKGHFYLTNLIRYIERIFYHWCERIPVRGPSLTYTQGLSTSSLCTTSGWVWTSISFRDTFIPGRGTKSCNWVGSGECPQTFLLSFGRPKLYPLQIVLFMVGDEDPHVGVTDQLLRSLGLALISILVLLMAVTFDNEDPIALWFTNSSLGDVRLGRNPTFILMYINSSEGPMLCLSLDIHDTK